MSSTLQIGGGAAQEIADFDFTAADLRADYFGESSLTLKGPLRLNDALLIGRFERCVYRADGTVRFVGWRATPPREATPGSQSGTYVLDGPAFWLKRKFFRGRITSTGSVTDDGNATSMTLGGAEGEEEEPEHIAVRLQILAILNQARTASDNAFDIAPMAEDFFTNEIPFEEKSDATCAELVRQLMGFMPTAVMRWTYGIEGDDTKPVLSFVDTEALAITQTLATGAPLRSLPEVRPVDELLRSQVDIVYTEADGTKTKRTAGPVEAGPASVLPFIQPYSFTLQAEEEVPAAGLEGKLLAYFSRLHVAAQPQYSVLDWSRLPGDVWGFSAAFPDVTGLRGVCGTIQRNLLKREESITLGPPPAPDTDRLSKRSAKANFNRNPTTPGGASDGGGSGPSESGTLTVEIAGAEGLDDGECPWTAHGPQTYQGTGETTINVQPGHYVVEFHTVFKLDDGLQFVSQSAPEVSIGVGGGATAHGDYSAVQRQRLKASDADEDFPTEIDLNTQDITDMGVPAGKGLLKVRKATIGHMGQPGWILRLEGESWADPE